MASIPSKLFTSFLRNASAYRSRDKNTSAVAAVKRSRRFTALMTLPQLPGTRTIDADIPNVNAQWHVGKWIREDVRMVYLHGGAYTAGSSKTHRHFTSILAKKTGIPVLSVDYRLAPEHPFPAAFDDAMAAYRYATTHGPNGAGNAQKVIIAGDSAGGGLSTAIAMQLRDEGALIDGGLLLISPWMDLTCSSGADQRIGHLDPMLDVDHAKNMAALYAGSHALKDPRISPLYGDFKGLPPIYMTLGGREIVLDEGLDALQRARAAGVDCTLERHEEMFHIWPVFFHFLPEGRQSVERMVAWLDRYAPPARFQ